MRRLHLLPALAVLTVLLGIGQSALAACTDPVREEGTIVYNDDHDTMQFCNGANWIAMGTNSGGDWLDGGSGKLYYNDGNVGIGTTNPTTLLQLGEDTLFHYSGVDIYFNDNGYMTAEGDMWVNIDGNNDQTGQTFTIGTDRIANTGGTNLLTVREDGNVGIGTNDPVGPLHIRTVVDAGTNSSGDSASLIIGDYSATHIQIDNNEIVAMTNSTTESTLHLRDSIQISGTAYKPGGGSWAATSDARLKSVDEVYDAGLDAVTALKPVRFHYKDGNARGEPTDKQYIGLVAQDAREVMPELVSEAEDGYLNLDSSSLTYALINAVKELKSENERLTQRIQVLEDAAIKK